MVMRCILGCSPPQTLFSIPKIRWLRTRWLEFLHIDEGGITENSRLCARHFTQECFRNFRQHEMGFVKVLLLSDTAVPSVYTVGASPSVETLTRDVGCQCTAGSVKSTAVQASCSPRTPKRRSKAVQVALSAGVSCSTGPLEPLLTPNKRPRVEDSETDESNTDESTDSTYESDDVKTHVDQSLLLTTAVEIKTG